jgi:hypothetical protein
MALYTGELQCWDWLPVQRHSKSLVEPRAVGLGHVAPYLEPACQEAIRYVESITGHQGPSLYTGGDLSYMVLTHSLMTMTIFYEDEDLDDDEEFEEEEDTS